MPRGRPKKITEPTDARKTVYEAKEEKKNESETTRFGDIFKLDESYTSLLLGIIVVIVAAVLFVSLFKNQNLFKPKLHQDIATQSIGPSLSPTNPEITSIPSAGASATVIPTQVPTAGLKRVAQATIQPPSTPHSVPAAKPVNPIQKTYTVKAGDDLWQIATDQYHDGYQWTKIAAANNLANPDSITVGQVITLPQAQLNTKNSQNSPTIITQSPTHISVYTVVHGDNLWNIAVRMYGDGFQWAKIATANNLANPRIIHAGNILKIP